jgi:glutathione synthase/RimK-type ligase-like ATP-grasp enzyme
LRVTVIGDEVFAAEIDSQSDSRTVIDWRHYEADIAYRMAVLPNDVTERCIALVRHFGLNFSAIDLILTPDGRYVFLENNPNGQFIFIERKVPELKMTRALASCLIRAGNS